MISFNNEPTVVKYAKFAIQHEGTLLIIQKRISMWIQARKYGKEMKYEV